MINIFQLIQDLFLADIIFFIGAFAVWTLWKLDKEIDEARKMEGKND